MNEISQSDSQVQSLFQQFAVEMAKKAEEKAAEKDVAEKAENILVPRVFYPQVIDPQIRSFVAYIIPHVCSRKTEQWLRLLKSVENVDARGITRQLFDELKNDIECSSLDTKGSLEMTIFNYLCLGLSRIYKGTLLDASIQLLCSALYMESLPS